MASSSLKINEASSSSSSTSNGSQTCENDNKNMKYDVFLSFRGEDTRKNLVSHLYSSLLRKGVNTFKDDDHNLDKGKLISPHLLKAIESSNISIVVLSRNYASSTWCLDELLQIMQCLEERKMEAVVPVFYGVDPSHVRKQTGSFGEALTRHQEEFLVDKVEKWRWALTKVANLSGWDSRDREEAIFIEEIVMDVLSKLMRRPSYGIKGLIGMDSRVQQMESLLKIGLNDVRMVGIWGMGGIGKSTIAKAVYHRFTGHFDGCCFLGSVKEVAGRHGLGYLQEEILNKILMPGNLKSKTMCVRLDAIKDRLHYMSVLIVLDNVDNLHQLEALAGEREWFGAGSRIIITTRDKHLLITHGVDDIYEAEVLSYVESVQVFSQYAFKKSQLKDEFRTLVHRAVNYAKGLPLALKVLGSFLCNKSILEWNNELDKLQRIPAVEIHNLLRASFDGLDDSQKNIFLDIACFFKGEDKAHVTKILEASGFFPDIGFRVLIDKSLITIVNDKVWMHDLLQEMGWEIVRQESYREPGKRSRLWNHEDVYNVFAKDSGTEDVEGIVVDLAKIIEAHFNVQVFHRMTKLRVLKICYLQLSGGFEYHLRTEYHLGHRSTETPGRPKTSSLHFAGELKALSDDLRCLYWHRYPLKSLPSNFYPPNLVELNMSHSNLVNFWRETKDFDKLKFIKLSHSQELTGTPDFTGISNLEVLILECCVKLIDVHPSVGFLKSLTLLNLRDCKRLQKFPRSIAMGSLEVLILSGCSKLDWFPEIQENMDHLSELLLDGTAIRELPESIGKLHCLVLLSAKGCTNLNSIPGSIGGLNGLKILNLTDCSKLEKLPTTLGSLANLEELYLSGTAVRITPLYISPLKKLKILSFQGCKGSTQTVRRRYLLQQRNFPNTIYFPSHFCADLSSLTSLDLSYCNLSTTALPYDFGMLSSLRNLNLSGNNFAILPPTISRLLNLENLHLADCNSLEILSTLPPSIYSLEAPNCLALSEIGYPSEVHGLCMRAFNFMNCLKLSKIADKSTLYELYPGLMARSYQNQAVILLKSHVQKTPSHSFAEFSLLIPGSGIDEWLLYEQRGCSVATKLPNHWYQNTFKGLALWVVFAVHNAAATGEPEHSLEFCLRCNGRNLISDIGFTLNKDPKVSMVSDHGLVSNRVQMEGVDHLWVRYFPCQSFKMTRTLDDWSQIEAIVEANNHGLQVKKCGLYPICWDDKAKKFMEIGETANSFSAVIL